jgi:vitamin B12 transporter
LKKVLIILSLLTNVLVYGQDSSATTQTIDSVFVTNRAIQSKLEAYSQELIKVNPNQSFAQLLQKQSGIFIKSTGVGSLSTPSYKGLGTAHTPIYIDGFNMQSSMNGTMDLSLIDASHFNNASFYEQSNYLVGPSNIGSALGLGVTNFKPSIVANVGGSSLKEKSLSASYKNISKKFRYSISASGTESPNQTGLEIYDKSGYQTNADYKKASVLQKVVRTGSFINLITNTIYLQASERGVPSTLTANSDGRQEDVNAMMGTKMYKFSKLLGLISIQNQIWHEKINYASVNTNFKKHSDATNINTSLYIQKLIGKRLSLNLGVGNENAFYVSNNIANDTNWIRWRANFGLTKDFKKSKLSFSSQLVNYNAKPVTNVKLHFERLIKKHGLFEVLGQKVYRLPTLNELYWEEPLFAFGNPDLKPESGYRLDLKFTRNTPNLMVKLNPFIGFYNNLIVWQGIPEIRAQNLQSVQVHGAELSTLYRVKMGKNELNINNNIHWVQSLNKPEDRKDPIWNKQLLFTPELTSNLTVSYSLENFTIYVNEQYVGVNYISSDNSSSLDPFLITEIGGYYEKDKWRIGFMVSNLFNTPYFSVPNLPQPGTVFKININRNFKIKSWKEKSQ